VVNQAGHERRAGLGPAAGFASQQRAEKDGLAPSGLWRNSTRILRT
jgi:hypothetical protein